jgi:polyisoprenyl-phosphate glycosyltransferase
MHTISFVIPVYRNEGSLHKTYEQIRGLFSAALADCDYEFVFVDDGSDDASLQELLAIQRSDRRVNVLALSRNFGQVPALIAGYRATTGDAVVNLSADLQEPVESIVAMVREWQAGNEIVICYRISRDDDMTANFSSKIFYRLMKAVYPQIPEGGFDFTLMSRKATNAFNAIDERNRSFQIDLLWLGFGIKFLPYTRLKRTIGKSQHTFSKKLKYAVDSVLNQSYIPIRFMSLAGTLTALSGFLYALVIVYARLTHNTPFTGWAPIMILLLVIGGAIMVMLGIIGEYIWRIYDETKKRPVYVVKQRYSAENQGQESDAQHRN